MKDQLFQALKDLQEKRIAQKKADEAKKEYFKSERGLALEKAKKEADEAEKLAKKTAYDIAAKMVNEGLPLDYGLKQNKASDDVSFAYLHDEAKKWCMEHADIFLQVDIDALDAYLKYADDHSGLPDFAKKITAEGEIKITIPTDLSKVLK